MVKRLSNILINNSFFLFGARGTGKTYWLEEILPKDSTHVINLLDPLEAEKFSLDPKELLIRIEPLFKKRLLPNVRPATQFSLAYRNKMWKDH